MTQTTGQVVVISGPSGSGKTSIIDQLRKHPRVRVSVSVTTRPPRQDEVDGKDYRFVDHDTFLKMAEEKAFVETNDVFGNGYLYGSTWQDVDDSLRDPEAVYIMEVDVVGASNLRATGLGLLYIFIEPPSIDDLAHRLQNRGTEDEQQVAQRLARAQEEMNQARLEGAHIVVNEDVDQAVEQIKKLLGLEENASLEG